MDKELIYLINLWEKHWEQTRNWEREYGEVGSYENVWKGLGEKLDSNLIKEYEKKGVKLIAFWDKRYPKLLKEMKGRPVVLCVKGAVEVLEGRLVAVVGTREPSVLGKKKISKAFDQLGEMVVISGLAKGTDKLAHVEALRRGWKTVAVLAHGLGMVYPKENEKLAYEIVESGGVLVSELPFLVTPKPRFFLERNRIVVGMSESLVVIEGGMQSGSMSSANLGAEMGKEVYAVKGSALTDLLLEEGAEGIK